MLEKLTPPRDKLNKVFAGRGLVCPELSAPKQTPEHTPPQFTQYIGIFLGTLQDKRKPLFYLFLLYFI